MSDLLTIEDLHVEFRERGKLTNEPLRGISLHIRSGEIMGVVGETGCGKSLTGLAVLGLLPQGAIPSGRIMIDGEERALGSSYTGRGDVVSLVFQNPGTAFNPVFTVGAQMTDVLKRHRGLNKQDRTAHIISYLEQVGLPDPERAYRAYPHELSGGMLQRCMIAMALVCEPKLLILDEPTTALDVTIAKQILDLVISLRDRFGFGVMLITHNLGVVQQVCDRVAVLYAGRVIETGTAAEVLGSPAHPYTRGLLGALPARHHAGQQLEAIHGSVPARLVGVGGCVFADRCTFAVEACLTTDPRLVRVPVSDAREVATNQQAACIRLGEI